MNSFYLFGTGALVAALAGIAFILGNTGNVQTNLDWSRYATTTFSISYPPGYVPDETYVHDIGPGRRATGVKFTVNPDRVAGTNLAPDSYLSVESLSTLVTCDATPYLRDPRTMPPVKDGAYTYSLARESVPGDASTYEETVYVRTGEGRCLAVHYVIHINNLGQYNLGTVRPFKSASLLEEFDKMRRSLVIR